MNRNPESLLEEILKHYDLTWAGIWVAFASRHVPSIELLVVDHSNGDEIVDGVRVASRLAPFLRHDLCPLPRVALGHSSLAFGYGLIGRRRVHRSIE